MTPLEKAWRERENRQLKAFQKVMGLEGIQPDLTGETFTPSKDFIAGWQASMDYNRRRK